MTLTLSLDQATALGNAGIRKLNYAKINPVDALSVYRLRHDVVHLLEEYGKTREDLIEQFWEDKEQLARVKTYEETHDGMTPEEYRSAIKANMPKVHAMMVQFGKEDRTIDVKPIAFTSWLQLLQDNPWLAGFEELLAGFINDESEK